MKRYLLFTFGNYYPCGGFEDYIDSFNTIEEAFIYWNNIPEIDRDYNCQIVDYTTLKIVQEYNL
jgi:hypothetical protein